MKTQSEHVQRWDDIIFEKRNKEYGAYAIRKNYNSRVLKAEAISVGIAALFFIVPILLRNDKIILPAIPISDPGIVILPYENIEPIITPPTPPQPPRKMDASIIPTRVTTKPVIDEPIVESKTDNVTYTTSSENGEVSSDAGSDVAVGSGTELVVEPPKIFTYVEKMPAYEGGDEAMMKFLQKNVRYPRRAQTRGAQGTVYVKFVVNSDGSVTDVEVEKGFDKECDAEALRVISLMNKWHAGIQNGTAVSVRKILPIKFRLE